MSLYITRFIGKTILLLICFSLVFSGCVQYRKYTGYKLALNPEDIIKVGYTKKQGVLEAFGPPSVISNQYDGEIFVYEYKLKKKDVFVLGDPVITGIFLLKYNRTKRQRDAFVVFFGHDEIVKSYSVSMQINN